MKLDDPMPKPPAIPGPAPRILLIRAPYYGGIVDGMTAAAKQVLEAAHASFDSIEVAGADSLAVRQKLEEVAGVARVVSKDSRDGTVGFEVEGMENFFVRPDLARAVVNSGWNLVELRAMGESLEEIFLELTKSEKKTAPAAEGAEGASVTQ